MIEKIQQSHLSQMPSYLYPDDAAREKHMLTRLLDIRWGNTRQTFKLDELGSAHFLIVGTARSGKTGLLQLLMKSVLTTQNKFYRLRYRCLINDPKQEVIPDLKRWGLKENDIIITNPFDERSSAWDVAADVNDAATAQQFVEDLKNACEKQNRASDQPFWDRVSTEVIEAIVEGLMLRNPTGWTLRDVIECASENEPMKRILEVTENGRKAIHAYFEGEGLGNLPGHAAATVRNSMAPLTIAAALWFHARTKFSFNKWRDKGAAIVLGYKMKSEQLTQPINHLLLKYASTAVIDPPGETSTDLSWFFIDEISNIGTVPNLDSLMDFGTGKGARVVTTALGFSNLRSAFSNKDDADSVIGQSMHKAILRLNLPDDVDFAQRLFGKVWKEKTTWSYPTGPDQYRSKTVTPVEEFLIEQEDLMNLHLRDERGIDAYMITGGGKPTRAEKDFAPGKLDADYIEELLGPYLFEPKPGCGPTGPYQVKKEPGLFERSNSHQKLPPWTVEDYLRFGLTPPKSNAKSESTTTKAESTHPSNDDSDIWKLRWE